MSDPQSILMPKQLEVRARISKILKTTRDYNAFLRQLDIDLNSKKSEFYLHKPVANRIFIDTDIITSLNDLKNLFEDNIVLPAVKAEYTPYYKRAKGKPANSILCNNLEQIIEAQDFNGEPFLKGVFKYEQILLPSRQIPMNNIFPTITAIVNGFNVCEKPGDEALKSLIYQLFSEYSPIKLKKIDAFQIAKYERDLELIFRKVKSDPQPLCGLQKNAKIIWNPDYDFTEMEKTTIFNQMRGKEQTSNTFEELKGFFREGMTKAELIKLSGKSKGTVYKYWPSLTTQVLVIEETVHLEPTG